MNKFKVFVSLITAIILISGCGKVSNGVNETSKQKKVTQLTMGTTSNTSSYYTLMVNIAKAVNEKVPEMRITAVESAAARENAQRMASGDFDMGLSDTTTSYAVFNGIEDFNDKANKEYRWILTYSKTPFMVIVRKDSGVKNLKDLEGKSFSPAQSGSSAAVMTEGAFAALGISPKFHRGSYSDAVEAIQNKQIVGMTKPSGGEANPDSAIMQVQASVPIDFLSFTSDDIKKIQEKYPYYQAYKCPPNVYKDQPKEIQTIGFAAGVAATSKLSEEMAYQLIKSVVESQDQIAQSFPALKGFDIAKNTLETANSPLHAGTVRYLKEIGLAVPAELIPPEYKEK